MAKRRKRPKAVLHIKKLRSIGSFLIKTRGIITNIENKAVLFAGLLPLANTVKADIAILAKAQAKADTRVRGAAATRDIKYDTVLNGIWELLGEVQILANAAPNELAAIDIITSAGFSVKGRKRKAKPALEARSTKTPGTVKLVAKAGDKDDFYNWQYSLNEGETWIDLPDTHKATTIVAGLTPGTRVWFRHRLVSRKKGGTDWSTPVSRIVE